MYHKATFTYVWIVKTHEKPPQRSRVYCLRCLQHLLKAQMSQTLQQPLYYLETYSFTARNGENDWIKWIHLTLKLSSLTVVQLCSRLSEKLQIKINTELLQSNFPIPSHVLKESLHRAMWDALSTVLLLQKAELWWITEVWHHRSFSQESRSLGAWAALSWVCAALKIAGSGADTEHQALPPAHLTFLLTSGSKPVGTVPRHCWWLPCSLGMLEHFPRVWTWRFTVCIAF